MATVFLCFLGTVLLAPWADCTQCHSRFHGNCVGLFDSCPSGYVQTLSYCDVLQSCCYKPHSAATTPSSGGTSGGSHTSGSCGNPTVASSHHRIVGGAMATNGAYPWQASLRYNNQHLCGGTLIDNQWILTAAHCFEDTSIHHGWTVALGIDNIYHTSGRVHQVSSIIVHHSYNSRTNKNDIALMKLSKPVDISGANVRPACLPSASDSFDHLVCTATGWGATREDGDVTPYMHEVDMPVIPNRQCSYYLERGDLFSSNLCAGYTQGGKDTCQGDSGGPLTCRQGGRWKVAGVVSWGYGCAQRKSPGIYTRVTSFLSWIASQKQNHHG